jgi:hypothetical protein
MHVSMDVNKLAYKDGVISIYPDGSFVGYIPNKVFSALYHQGLVVKVAPKKWIIPEDKRNQVTNLQVVDDVNASAIPAQGSGLHGVKVGDVFSMSWGYDQTNWNFVVVTRISSTGKTAFVKKCGADHVDDEGGHFTVDSIVPNGKPIDDREYRMKIEQDYKGEKPQLCGSADFYEARIWSLVESDEIFRPTSLGFGH